MAKHSLENTSLTENQLAETLRLVFLWSVMVPSENKAEIGVVNAESLYCTYIKVCEACLVGSRNLVMAYLKDQRIK